MDLRTRMLLAGLVLVCAVAIARSAQAVTRDSDSAFIFKLCEARARAMSSRDLATVVSCYADDRSMLALTLTPATSQPYIRDVWADLMAQPGYSMRCASTRIDVASGGDMACDIGRFTLTFADRTGALVTVAGHYVTVWRKQDGNTWKVYADSFNAQC